jgi:L-alanine-DL-glutamate epimerase-like enolase superfamily enzyme
MKITKVDLMLAPMANNWLTDRVIANPMSAYPEYVDKRSSWYRTQTAGVVVITVEDGTRGFGFVGGAKASACAPMLDEQVRHLLLGKSCFDTELISEQIYRATIMYGQGGAAACLASGIDIALWDLKGKILDCPVYQLWGGQATPALKPYLTSWDSEALAKFGINDVKIAMPYGPAAGEVGKRANVEIVEKTRSVIGPDGFIALDCYMAWDVPYTIDMYHRLKDYGIAWIEEPVMPEDILGYRSIRDKVDCMVSGGEHTFTLEGFRRLIVDGGVDIVQPDIYRAGGPTVLKKVAALAKAYGRQLICHGVGLPTYHFLISNGPEVSRRCEYLDIYAGSPAGWVLNGEPTPFQGELKLSDLPGFGYSLNESVFESGESVSPIW